MKTLKEKLADSMARPCSKKSKTKEMSTSDRIKQNLKNKVKND